MHSAQDAIQHGIGMVHQHFMLIPVMTVAENIVLGTEPNTAGIFLDHRSADRRVRELAQSFNFAIDPDARVQDITVGQQQRVEILKALYRRADILILDEPTAVLTPSEANDLFAILKIADARGDVGDLHQPQAARGARDRGPDQRAPSREARRHGAAGGGDRAGPRPLDGGARGRSAGGQGAGESGRDAPRGRGAHGRGRPRSPGGTRRELQRACRRDRGNRRRRRQRTDGARRGSDRPQARERRAR